MISYAYSELPTVKPWVVHEGNLHLISISKFPSAEPSVTKGIPFLPPILIPNLSFISSKVISEKECTEET